MNETLTVSVLVFSTLLSILHIILSLLVVPHIFGFLLSSTTLIFNILALVYILKVKKKVEIDYKVQYEKIGAKKKKDCLSLFVRYFLYISYLFSNMFMFTMVILRIIQFSGNIDNIYLTRFPE